MGSDEECIAPCMAATWRMPKSWPRIPRGAVGNNVPTNEGSRQANYPILAKEGGNKNLSIAAVEKFETNMEALQKSCSQNTTTWRLDAEIIFHVEFCKNRHLMELEQYWQRKLLNNFMSTYNDSLARLKGWTTSSRYVEDEQCYNCAPP